MAFDIRILDQSAYRSFLEEVDEGKQLTHIAMVEFDKGQSERAYVKAYQLPKQGFPKGIVNEITGLLLADALELPGPEKASLMWLPSSLLKSSLGANVAAPIVPCLVTSELPGKTPKQHYRNDPVVEDVMRDEISQWQHFARSVAFDEWLANGDRNTGNLVRTGKHQFALIDHGEALMGHNWTANKLKKDYSPRMKLLQFVYENEGTVPPDVLSKIITNSADHTVAYSKAMRIVEDWWSKLTNANEARAISRFVRLRADSSEDRLKKCFGMIL